MPVRPIPPRQLERIFTENPWVDPRSYADAANDDRPSLPALLAEAQRRRPSIWVEPGFGGVAGVLFTLAIAELIGAMLAVMP